MNSFSHHAEFPNYATNKRDYAAQERRRVVLGPVSGASLLMWKITITSWVFYAAIKPRPGPWLNNPMLDNLLVTPVIFIKTGCGSVNWRCWRRGELSVTGPQYISWDAAAACSPSLPLISRNLRAALTRLLQIHSPTLRRTEEEGKGLYCQGWHQCNARYWYLSLACIKMKYERLTGLRQVSSLRQSRECSLQYSY